MLALIVTTALLPQPSCVGEAAAMAEATARAMALDLPGAAASLEITAVRGCARAEMARLYVRGLVAARSAYSRGGDPESLRPVRDAIAQLGSHVANGHEPAEIARLVLLAAASAAQSERDEMGVFLEQAVAVETLQLDAGAPGAPLVTAHDVAGDLWLRVHQYERARLAYKRAVEKLGVKPGLVAGLALVAARLKDVPSACAEYSTLLERWRWSANAPPEITEARVYLKQQACRSRFGERRRE